MCNLSQLIEERAIKKANTEKIEKMIRLGCTEEFIFALDFTEEEYLAAKANLCLSM